ncbi:MAG: OmpH family outer membrane protein [Gemmobacter sp.]|uniref:OmpH family outer membrane protein n=1 Tax=Gemmobacter sp. TaxID=1898957 RepID=UPI001A573199|nr:OmpH family outer membrane protein [Gemmobacter sp.]MBL8563380.1 OmpH family outer membrane protein [Gemmobacter sp.]
MPGAARLRSLALAALFLAGSGAGALAQPLPTAASPPSGVAVLSQDQLFSGSAFGKALLARDEAARRVLQAENQRLDAALEAEERDLTARRASMAPQEFAALASAFDAKVKGIRAAQEAKVRDLAREADLGRQTFADAARPVLEALMRETGATVLLDRSTVVMLRDGADLTASAIARIDAVLGDGTALPPKP